MARNGNGSEWKWLGMEMARNGNGREWKWPGMEMAGNGNGREWKWPGMGSGLKSVLNFQFPVQVRLENLRFPVKNK